MTEEKLAPKGLIASKRRIIGLVLALFAIFVAALWLFRQPIAEAIARSVCSDQKLSCKVSITRLDFGRVTLTGLDARAPEAANAALSARELAIDLAWDSLFSPRPSAVSGDELLVRVDLTGKRPLLGDLDIAIANFTKPSDAPPAPLPRINFKKITVIGETLSGPMQAIGAITATGADAFVIDLTAAPATLGMMGATMQLAGGQLKATVANKQISANAKLDLAKFEATDISISNVKIDATLEQIAGVLKGAGSATLGEVAVKDTRLKGAHASASVESAAVDPAALDVATLLAGLRKLELSASTGEGAVSGASWKKAELTALIAPKGLAKSGGDIVLAADEVRIPQGVAGRVELTGVVDITEGIVGTAQGTARVRAAVVTAVARKQVVDAISLPLEAALPVFGSAAAEAIDRAALNFDVVAPWSAASSPIKGIEVTLREGGEVRAASGLLLKLVPPKGQQNVASFSTAHGGAWLAAGSLQLSGGGGPRFSLDISKASGGGTKLAFVGAASLKPWQVGSDAIAAEFTGLDFGLDDMAGKASGQLTVNLNGAFGGGVWKGARGTGAVDAVWDRQTFAADAPRGVVIQWSEARYGETVFGAAALRYSPQGRLAERVGEGVVGRGSLDAVNIPVKGGAWNAKAALGAVGINWRAEGGFRANFNAAPIAVDMTLDQRKVPIRIADVAGELDLRDGWRVKGAFSGGNAQAEEGTVADLAGKFNLGGKGDALDGSLSDIVMRVFDPKTEQEGKRFEEVKFEGSATLRNSVADFTGGFAMAKSGMQIAHVTGRHSLDNNEGLLTFDPIPLIFAPRVFQPYDLSPMLRGPAGVTGRADISGAVAWTANGLKASATADLRKVGFALASAGVFEGVSGKVEIADLINMKSAPGQQITIDKVTLGLPIEKGAIRFQLVGYDSIRLEGAEWPFGGGFIRIRPTNFAFTTDAENRIVAQAVNWDLAKLVEQFKLPDIKLVGIVAGDFPVAFRTGSATIDNATLEALKEGGVIQYSGSPGDAAAQGDKNSKMVFDALKDFRYQVLKVGLNGDLAGRMVMSINVLGRNPNVLGGQPFQLNISLDSELVRLLTSTTSQPDIRTAVGQAIGGKQ
jgi:translocation and assembly module TamB